MQIGGFMKRETNIKLNTQLIKNYLKENNLSITKFCEMCNIGRSSYYSFMRSNLRIKATIFVKIAKFTKNKVEDLFIRESVD